MSLFCFAAAGSPIENPNVAENRKNPERSKANIKNLYVEHFRPFAFFARGELNGGCFGCAPFSGNFRGAFEPLGSKTNRFA
jgi:hypothetical protein